MENLCRILATETRASEGDRRASSVIWLYRGSQLIKASPAQIRPATPRKEAWNELNNPGTIPWTISDSLRVNPPHTFGDVTADRASMPENPGELEEITPAQGSRDGAHHEKSSRHEDLEAFRRSRSPLQRGRPVASQRVLSRDYLQDCGIVFPVEPSKHWQQDRAAIEISFELPRVNTKQGKEWTRDLGCFFAKQLRKNNVEVREKLLTLEQQQGFKQAKQKEVKNFLVAQAFQKIPPHLGPSQDQILRMLDENPSPNQEPLKRDSSNNRLKPKARAWYWGIWTRCTNIAPPQVLP